MARKYVVGVVGSDDSKGMSHAYDLGKLLGDKDWVVISGGRNNGVMAEINRGLKDSARKCALALGILLSADSKVSPNVDVAVFTDLNNARNNIIGLSCNVLIACGIVGAGTASEVALALKNNKCRVVILDAVPVSKSFYAKLSGDISFVSTPAQALEVCETLRSKTFS
jgi:uncharacterized protein (TIGR00725 family)